MVEEEKKEDINGIFGVSKWDAFNEMLPKKQELPELPEFSNFAEISSGEDPDKSLEIIEDSDSILTTPVAKKSALSELESLLSM